MPENKLQELEKDKRGDALKAITSDLETAMRAFLLDTYLRAIPADKFGGFWGALGCCKTGNKGLIPPVVERDTLLRYMGADFQKEVTSGSKKDWLKDPKQNEAFFLAAEAAYKKDNSEKLRRNVLGCLDITGFFKFSFLDSDYRKQMHGTVYGMLAMRYAKVSALGQNGWKELNNQARDGRNDKIGHVNSHTFRDMDVAEWRSAMDAWVKIANCLHDAQNDALYKRIMKTVEDAENLQNNTLYTLQNMAADCPGLTLEQITEILGIYHYKVENGAVFCTKEDVLKCLHHELYVQNIEKINAELRAEQEQTRREMPMASEAVIISAALEKRLEKIPKLQYLPACKGEPLEGRTLQELAETHYIVLTAALLKSPEGRSFVSSRLLPALKYAKRDPRKALIVDSTTLYHLFRQREEYAKLTEQYRTTLWTPPREAERLELYKRCKELRSADSAYFFVRDLKLPTLGAPDPLSTDDEAILSVMESHPFDRFCVLLCGAAGFVRMIDRKRLPFVQVGRVRAGVQHPICSLFPQLMPIARAASDEPLLADLLATYSEALENERSAEEEPEDEPNKAPAPPETPPEHAVEAATASAPARPEPVPEPAAPAPQSAPEPQPVQTSPVQPEPQPKPIQKPGNRHHGSAPFPPNLPLRKMDETLLPCRVRPAAGLTLRTEDGDPVTLRGALMEGDEEAKGGAGSLYLTDTPGQVAKIYNAEHLTAGRRDKLDEMLRHDPQIRGLCWPTHMLYTRKGDFIGYTMPQAPEGALPFSKSVLRIGSPSVREKLLKDWDRLDLVQAARSAAYIVAQLHRRNILMGDVNAGNFMVDPGNSANVYVVDTDSFQLGGFPCPVGVEDFTHPGTAQRLGVTGALKFDTFLRTPDEENYVLAIMLFKVLFLNQNPFVTKTKMTYREAMAAKKFSYALDGDDYEVPDGDNWMIWKNLPRKVSDAFTAAFTQWKCATAYEWVGLLDYYAASIRKYGFSRELAPMKYHEFRPDDPIYVDLVCPCCHKEFNIHKNRYAKLHDEFHTPIFCRNCNASLQQHGNEVLHNSLTCVKCGRKYDATFRENMYARAEPQKALCPNCRPRRTYYTRGR